MVVSFKQKKRKRAGEKGKNTYSSRIFIFRERISNFSLDLRAIRSLEFFRARRKVALCGKAYAWAPVLRSFDKIREVGDLSYLGLHFI